MCLNALARYLLAVYQLSADGAAVRSVEIANALGVSRASVVKSLKKLAEGGFVQKEYYGSVHLTPQGLREAGRLHREYTLLSSYFTSCLACPKAAAEKGIKIYTIGIGSPEGAPIPIDGNFIKDEKGNMVVSKLDEATLEQIALSTGGAYIRATNRSLGLDEIVKKINEVEKKQLSSSVFEDFNEQYQYLIGIGLLLLLIEFVMLERKSRILSRLNIFRKQ